MFPSQSFYNLIDSFMENVEFYGNLFVCHFRSYFSYFQNLRFSKFMTTTFFSKSLYSSAFFNAITNIIFLSPKPEMCWVNTCPIIARVADIQALRNISFKNLPSISMRSLHLIINSKLTISFIHFIPYPNPACRSFLDIFKKSFDWIGTSNKSSAFHTNPSPVFSNYFSAFAISVFPHTMEFIKSGYKDQLKNYGGPAYGG